jgi:FKBP-type peptidyl-prolyl cis-trans isomerase 2
VIADGQNVSLEYTLTLNDGTQVESNVGEEPLVYQQGANQLLPALEQQLAGMEVNEHRKVTLAPEDAYGAVRPDLFQEVDAERIPEDARKAGTRLMSEDPSGNRRLIRVHEVKGDRIVLDQNHPLAGETIHFDLRIVAIE